MDELLTEEFKYILCKNFIIGINLAIAGGLEIDDEDMLLFSVCKKYVSNLEKI